MCIPINSQVEHCDWLLVMSWLNQTLNSRSLTEYLNDSFLIFIRSRQNLFHHTYMS